ncbi:MAG: aspartyl protease family protein [Pirellulales bacterium]|nr:aspartyl protease family protein [Pirellulales bacterium]
MIFNYTTIISTAPEDGEPMLIMRPEIFITIHGATRSHRYLGLVDTGADFTVFPESVAEQIGIKPTPGSGPAITAFGGQQLRLSFADVDLEISDGESSCRWNARIQFADIPSAKDETLLLGHVGFLEFFSATFYGEQCELELSPNANLLLS